MNSSLHMIKLSDYSAFLFDLDGTLVDSMGMWKDIDYIFLHKRNLSVPDGLQLKISGMSMYETALYFKKTFALSDSPEELMNEWNDMARDEYRYKIGMKPGALEFLKEIFSRRIPSALCTSNSRFLVSACLSAHKLLQQFDVIITSDDIKSGKPAPDIYIMAAERLNVDPKKCLVFEDTLQGIMASKAAGCDVIGIDDRYTKDHFLDKQKLSLYMIDDFREIKVIS